MKPPVPDAPYEVSTLPPRLSPYPSPLAGKDPKSAGHHSKPAPPVLSAANLLYDKYRLEMQKSYYAPALVVSGIRPPGQTVPHPHSLSGKSEGFYGDLADKYLQEVRGACVCVCVLTLSG